MGQNTILQDEPDLHHPLPVTGKPMAGKQQFTVKKMGQVYLKLLLVPFGSLLCPRDNTAGFNLKMLGNSSKLYLIYCGTL